MIDKTTQSEIDQLKKDVDDVFGDFLPKDYETPNTSRYMKFQGGENRFRILTSPILGYEGWKTSGDGTRKPVRRTMDGNFHPDDVDDPEEVKHFWAMVVWNYKEKSVQILEITQKVVMKAIRSLSANPEWGTPLKYDLSVIKDGEKMLTKYQVVPNPHKALAEEVEKAWAEAKPKIDLNALYTGDNPFK